MRPRPSRDTIFDDVFTICGGCSTQFFPGGACMCTSKRIHGSRAFGGRPLLHGRAVCPGKGPQFDFVSGNYIARKDSKFEPATPQNGSKIEPKPLNKSYRVACSMQTCLIIDSFPQVLCHSVACRQGFSHWCFSVANCRFCSV